MNTVSEIVTSYPVCVGYIGGSVLLRLLEHPDVATFKFTALVRSQEKVEKLQALGVNAVRGSLQDLALLENLASEADIVISLVHRFITRHHNLSADNHLFFLLGRLGRRPSYQGNSRRITKLSRQERLSARSDSNCKH